MIIIDDRLSRTVLGDERPGILASDVLATTWGFPYRLLRALIDQRVDGRVSRGAAAELAIGNRLNLLVAELLAAAERHRATIALSEGNVGRSWPALFEDHDIPLEIVA